MKIDEDLKSLTPYACGLIVMTGRYIFLSNESSSVGDLIFNFFYGYTVSLIVIKLRRRFKSEK
jgi:hypothetical protein